MNSVTSLRSFRRSAIFPSPAGAAAATAIAACIGCVACTSPLHLPPVLQACVTDGSVPCMDSVGGGSVELPVESGASEESGEGIMSQGVEGGGCGTADAILANIIAGPCAPCVVQNCCQADSICSAGDGGCLSLVACIVDPKLCPSLTLAPTTDYDDLHGCFTMYCPTQCLPIPRSDF